MQSESSLTSVPAAVRVIILRNRTTYEALRLGIVNYHALAAVLKPDVDRLLGKEVSTNTIVVAIKRFTDSQVEETEFTDAIKVLRGSKLSLTGGYADLTVQADESETTSILEKLYQLAPELRSRPSIHLMQNFVKVFAEIEDTVKVKEQLRDASRAKLRTDLANLVILLLPEAEETPGILSFITDILYRAGINVLAGVISGERISLILEEDDAARAYELLRQHIRG